MTIFCSNFFPFVACRLFNLGLFVLKRQVFWLMQWKESTAKKEFLLLLFGYLRSDVSAFPILHHPRLKVVVLVLFYFLKTLICGFICFITLRRKILVKKAPVCFIYIYIRSFCFGKKSDISGDCIFAVGMIFLFLFCFVFVFLRGEMNNESVISSSSS